MARNVFALRTSEQSSSDAEFTRNFAADALEVLPQDLFKPGALVIRSAPGGGKTSLLRLFTPGPLIEASRNRSNPPYDEIFAPLQALEAVDKDGPRILGVYLSSAKGYAEIGPPFSEEIAAGLFKALVNARIVLRTLRAVATLCDLDYATDMERISVEPASADSPAFIIPRSENGAVLKVWAEEIEGACLRHLDALNAGPEAMGLPLHSSLDALHWLTETVFLIGNKKLQLPAVLMFDDVQRLRPWQRRIIYSESMEHRTPLAVWIAEQTKALDPEEVLSDTRHERDHRVLELERAWSDKVKRFQQFAMAIADRRLKQVLDDPNIAASLSSDFAGELEAQEKAGKAVTALRSEIEHYRASTNRYDHWLRAAEEADTANDFQRATALAKVKILISRDINRSQRLLDLEPLPDNELAASGLNPAAERFVCRDFNLPYYYGIERITRLASFNIDEFLQLCSSLFDLIHAVRVLRTRRPAVTAFEQDNAVRKLATKKFEELSRSVRHGEMAKRLVSTAGTMFKERTYEANAPYAPGVTGFGISPDERIQLAMAGAGKNPIYKDLADVITSCVAQNVFDMREIRHDGRQYTVFYLNRTLCAHFELVYHQGGWQRVSIKRLLEWCRGHASRSDGRMLL